MILRFWEIILKMWTGCSQVNLAINSNLFSEFLSLYCINWYVRQKTCLNSYVAHVLDKTGNHCHKSFEHIFLQLCVIFGLII